MPLSVRFLLVGGDAGADEAGGGAVEGEVTAVRGVVLREADGGRGAVGLGVLRARWRGAPARWVPVAAQELRERGLIVTVRGKGSFVVERPPAAGDDEPTG